MIDLLIALGIAGAGYFGARWQYKGKAGENNNGELKLLIEGQAGELKALRAENKELRAEIKGLRADMAEFYKKMK